MGGADTEVRDDHDGPRPRARLVRARARPAHPPRARPEHRGELSLRARHRPLERAPRRCAAASRSSCATAGGTLDGPGGPASRAGASAPRSSSAPRASRRCSGSTWAARGGAVPGRSAPRGGQAGRCAGSRWRCPAGAPTSRPRSTWSRRSRGCTATTESPTELRPFRAGTLPDAPAALTDRIRRGLVAEGLLEVVSLPFTAADGDASVAVLNPFAGDGASLRRRLLPGLVRRVEHNWASRPRCAPLRDRHGVRARGPASRPVERLRSGVVLTGAREPAHWTDAGARHGHLGPKGLFSGGRCLAHPGARGTLKGRCMARTKDGHVGWAGPLEADRPLGRALFGVEIDVAEARARPCSCRSRPARPSSATWRSCCRTAWRRPRWRGDPAGGWQLLEAVRVVAEYRGAAWARATAAWPSGSTSARPTAPCASRGGRIESQVLGALERELGLTRRGAEERKVSDAYERPDRRALAELETCCGMPPRS